jgi:hypothetical protein
LLLLNPLATPENCAELHVEIDARLISMNEVQIGEIEDGCKGADQSNSIPSVCHQDYGEDIGFWYQEYLFRSSLQKFIYTLNITLPP